MNGIPDDIKLERKRRKFEENVKVMSVKALKNLCDQVGLSHADCVDKSELRLRGVEAQFLGAKCARRNKSALSVIWLAIVAVVVSPYLFFTTLGFSFRPAPRPCALPCAFPQVCHPGVPAGQCACIEGREGTNCSTIVPVTTGAGGRWFFFKNVLSEDECLEVRTHIESVGLDVNEELDGEPLQQLDVESFFFPSIFAKYEDMMSAAGVGPDYGEDLDLQRAADGSFAREYHVRFYPYTAHNLTICGLCHPRRKCFTFIPTTFTLTLASP